jgi:AcrR family transcriptional regulator
VKTVLAAATRVLAKHSLPGFNTNRVAEVAGVSIGSLYQYFPNKAALIVAVLEREHERLASALEATVKSCAGQSLGDGLLALARLAIEQQYHDPVLAAALDHEEQRLPIDAQLAGYEQRMLSAVMMFLEQHSAALPSGRVAPETARDLLLIARALVEAEAQVAKQPPSGLEQRMVRALHGYLIAP